MSTKHTPGEWKVRVEGFDEKPYWGDVEVYTDDYGKVCAMADNWSLWNSEKNEEPAIDARKEAEANAKLIAAAPEMRLLLEEEVKFLDMWMGRIAAPESLMSVEMKERKEFIQMTISKASQ